MSTEFEQLALTLPTEKAEALCLRMKHSTFLSARGIEVFTTEVENKFPLPTGEMVPASYVKIRASTPRACGIGIGFVVAISEGFI